MRLFLATPLDKEITPIVQDYQPPAKEEVRLVRPDLLHMTLQFIGEEDPDKVDRALHNISFQSFTTNIIGTGHFSPKKGKKILWLSTQLNEHLAALYKDISDRLLANNIKLESRSYTPHITLARCRKNIEQSYLDNFLGKEITPIIYSIERFHLYHSYQRDGQLQYEPIRTYESQASM